MVQIQTIDWAYVPQMHRCNLEYDTVSIGQNGINIKILCKNVEFSYYGSNVERLLGMNELMCLLSIFADE